MLYHNQLGGKLCSLIKTNPLAILHLFTIPCKEIINNRLFYQTIENHYINYVQLSPIQDCRLIQTTDEVRKNPMNRWYLLYQPISNKIGNELHGTENDIITAVNQFNERGINVIADVVLGHLRHVQTFQDDNQNGIKYFIDRDGMKILLHISRIELVNNDKITIDNINKIKYSFYDVIYNLEKYYGEDFIELETKILDLNSSKDIKKIFNKLLNNHEKIVKSGNPNIQLRDDNMLLSYNDVKLIRIDLLKFINEMKNIICDYLEINISEFKNEYYDCITAPFNRNSSFQLQWLYSMPKLNHNNKLVQGKCFEYMKKLANIGIRGLRFDYAIGFDPDILARYSEYFYQCVPNVEKNKIYIYHEIVDFGRQIDFNENGSSLYKKNAYLNNVNYQLSTYSNDLLKVSYTSYANLYDTLSIIIDKNYSALKGLSIDEDNVVVFSESHDTLWGQTIDDPKSMWYRGEQSRNNRIIFTAEERITISMLMLCYFLTRSCRISLIYLNQINFDGVFAIDTLCYQIYNRYKPIKIMHDNVLKCLQFRKFLIENEIGNESGNEQNWENDANFNSVYISTKYIGSREAVATIFINFGSEPVNIPVDNITIMPNKVYIKYENSKEIIKKLGYKIKH
jgi:glycosidase